MGDGKTHYFNIPIEKSIWDLKLLIYDRIGLPPDIAKLTYASKLLMDDTTIQFNGIQKDSTLMLGTYFGSVFGKYEKLVLNGYILAMKSLSINLHMDEDEWIKTEKCT
jgi:hypothetical protein